MSYVRQVLQPGENVVYSTQLHWLIYLPTLFLLVICVAFFAGSTYVEGNLALALEIVAGVFALLALSAGIGAFTRRATTELAVTNHRVIYKSGLLSRHTLEMNLARVESVDVDQTVLGRIFGYGEIVVRGTGGSLEPIRNISDPLTFRSHITAV